MIGIRAGIKCGLRVGIASGIGNDPIAVGSSWTKDGTKGVPTTVAEWNAVRTAAGIGTGAPSSKWEFQDASGNAADSLGSVPLVALNAPSYQQPVAGWIRKSVSFAENSTSRFTVASGTGPNPATTSVLWFAYVLLNSAPAASRQIMIASDTNTHEAQIRVTLTPRYQNVINNAVVAGASSPLGAVRPLLLKYDRTNGTAATYTDQEKIVSVYNAGVTDGTKGFGATALNAPAANVLYGCVFTGANAELSDAQIKALLQTLGWPILW